MSRVSYFVFPISYIVSDISSLRVSPISCLSRGSCLMSRIVPRALYLAYRISRLLALSPIQCLVSRVSYPVFRSYLMYLLSNISYFFFFFVSHISRLGSSVSYLLSNVPYLVCRVPYLLYISYFVSYVSWFLAFISRLLFNVLCLTSPIECFVPHISYPVFRISYFIYLISPISSFVARSFPVSPTSCSRLLSYLVSLMRVSSIARPILSYLVIYLRCYCPLSRVWCPVAWPVSRVPRPVFCVPCPMSGVAYIRWGVWLGRHASCLVSRGAQEHRKMRADIASNPPMSSYLVMSYKLSSCFVSCVPCLVSRISRVLCLRLLSRVSCVVSHVSCLVSPVSRLASCVPCLVSVSRLVPRVSCLVSCLVPCIWCLVSHVSCLLSCGSCLASRVSCHVMSCHVTSCHVTSCHVMSCHVTPRHVIPWTRGDSNLQTVENRQGRRKTVAVRVRFPPMSVFIRSQNFPDIFGRRLQGIQVLLRKAGLFPR